MSMINCVFVIDRYSVLCRNFAGITLFSITKNCLYVVKTALYPQMAANVKQQCYQSSIFVGEDGQKYAVNPFAAVSVSDDLNLLKPKSVGTFDRQMESYNNRCSHCDINFDDLNEYAHHNVEMHGQKKLLNCTMCDATFRRQDHLKRHMQSLHTYQKFCKCPVCGKDFQRKDILLKHIKKKHSDKPEIFHCRECQFQCSNLTELDEHELVHSSTEARHECFHCKMTFKRRDHMLRHVKSQHLNQVVVCPVCGQMYKRKDHVVRHVREKHKMGLLNGKLVKSADLI